MILGFIEKYDKMTPEELVEQRYQRFQKNSDLIGLFVYVTEKKEKEEN